MLDGKYNCFVFSHQYTYPSVIDVLELAMVLIYQHTVDISIINVERFVLKSTHKMFFVDKRSLLWQQEITVEQ